MEAAAARLWVQELREISEVKPDIMDLANLDEIGRHAARALDLPVGTVVSREQVKAIRAQRAEEQQETLEREKVAQEMEIAATGGKAAKDIGKALEGVPPEALQQLT